MTKSQRLALAAAQAASEAGAELLRFVREGPGGDLPFVDEDTVLRLADALQLAIRIEQPFLQELAPDPGYAAQRDANETLRQACLAMLEREATA